ncbi:MAG: hypothetical protein ACNS63_12540 [Candidatus Nitrospinota bacterium M3_3B_026]
MSILSNDEIEEFYSELEKDGVETVHRKLANRVYGGPPHEPLAKKWLERKRKKENEERQQLEDKIKEREISINQKAADAADRSANHARVSNIIAVGALIVSFIALHNSCESKNTEQTQKVEQNKSTVPLP